MSRKKQGAPFSLFSFQDAVTATTGVVVLITLLLAIQLASRASGRAQEYQNAVEARKLEQRLKETREKIKIASAPSESTKFVEDAIALSESELAEKK